MKNCKAVNEAIDTVFDELNSLSKEEFQKRLDEVIDTDRYHMIRYMLDHNYKKGDK